MGKVIKSKKGIALLAALVVAIAAAVGAYAYFTASGTGTGTASVGMADTIALSSPLVGDLYPDGADVPVTVTIDNAAGSGSQFVDTVSGSVADNGACLGAWFEVDDITYQDTIAAGASDTAGTFVRMLDSGTNQNACQGLTMTINWTSN
jgi:hypothetical protein